jgi:hypothetical protein
MLYNRSGKISPWQRQLPVPNNRQFSITIAWTVTFLGNETKLVSQINRYEVFSDEGVYV